MSIRLAVFDLDGTLLRTGHRITDEAAAGVAALVADGLPVALASARLDDSIRVVEQAIGVPVHRISYNGALATLADGRVVHEAGFTITFELAEPLATFTEVGAIDVYTADGRWLAFGLDAAIDREERDTWCTATSREPRAGVEALVGLQARKIMVEGPHEQVGSIDEAVAGIEGLNLTYSGMGLHDVWPSSSGKGNALAAVCEALGITPDEVVACGDSETDLPMLTLAGTSIGVQPGAASVAREATRLVQGAGSAELFRAVREVAGLPPR